MAKRRKSPAVKLPPLPRVMVPHPHVRCDSRLLSGSPHVEGSRVPVRRLWAWHRSGVSIDTLLKRYPRLGPARVLDALAFAYDNREVVEADLARDRRDCPGTQRVADHRGIERAGLATRLGRRRSNRNLRMGRRYATRD